MECKEVKRKIAAFVCNNLLQHEEKILKNHIQTCHECKQMLNKFNMLKNTIKTIELNGEEVFINKTMSRINELQQRRLTYRYKDIFNSVFKKRKWIAYASTVLLVLVIFSYVLGLFNIFKPQEVNAQEILMKSLTSPDKIKSYHKKVTNISYPPYNYLGYKLGYKQECKTESWFKAPNKIRHISKCSYPDKSYIDEHYSEVIILGNKNWQLQPDGTWILYKERDTSGWFYNSKEIKKLRERIFKFQEESETNLIKEDKIAGRKVYVIEYIYHIDGKDYKSILYIDKETFFILAGKGYENNVLVSETICDIVEYDVEIDDSIFNPPPDELVKEASSIGLDFEYVNNIYEAEKKAGYNIPIPKYTPEGYSLGEITICPKKDFVEVPTYNRYGKIIKTETMKNPYRCVFIIYGLYKEEGNIVYLGHISIKFDKKVGLTDNELNLAFWTPLERARSEEIQINKDVKVFYKPEFKSSINNTKSRQELRFAYNSIWIEIEASSDISKDELIKIANSILD